MWSYHRTSEIGVLHTAQLSWVRFRGIACCMHQDVNISYDIRLQSSTLSAILLWVEVVSLLLRHFGVHAKWSQFHGCLRSCSSLSPTHSSKKRLSHPLALRKLFEMRFRMLMLSKSRTKNHSASNLLAHRCEADAIRRSWWRFKEALHLRFKIWAWRGKQNQQHMTSRQSH